MRKPAKPAGGNTRKPAGGNSRKPSRKSATVDDLPIMVNLLAMIVNLLRGSYDDTFGPETFLSKSLDKLPPVLVHKQGTGGTTVRVTGLTKCPDNGTVGGLSLRFRQLLLQAIEAGDRERYPDVPRTVVETIQTRLLQAIALLMVSNVQPVDHDKDGGPSSWRKRAAVALYRPHHLLWSFVVRLQNDDCRWTDERLDRFAKAGLPVDAMREMQTRMDNLKPGYIVLTDTIPVAGSGSKSSIGDTTGNDLTGLGDSPFGNAYGK